MGPSWGQDSQHINSVDAECLFVSSLLLAEAKKVQHGSGFFDSHWQHLDCHRPLRTYPSRTNSSWSLQAGNQITCQIGLGGARGAVIIFIASDMTSKTLVAHQAKILNVCFKCHHILQWGKENRKRARSKIRIIIIKSYEIISSQDTNDFSVSAPPTWKSRPSESFNRCWWAPIPHWKYIIRHMFLGPAHNCLSQTGELDSTNGFSTVQAKFLN